MVVVGDFDDNELVVEGKGKSREKDTEDKENEDPMLDAVIRTDHYRAGDEGK